MKESCINQQDNFVMRPQIKRFAVPIMMCALLTLFITIVVLIKSKKISDWYVVLLMGGISTFLISWLLSPRIKVESGVLRYSSLWSGTRAVPLENIIYARIEAGEKRYRDRHRPMIRLVIRYRDGIKPKSFDIPFLPFATDEMQRLLALFESHGVFKRNKMGSNDNMDE